MDVVPPGLERAARGWEGQQLDLEAAAGQIRSASTAGFTGPVAGAASRFTTSWERFASSLATESAAQAEGLRAALRGYVVGDEAEGLRLLRLASCVREAR